MKRIFWIDNAKAIAIFLVILGHTKLNPIVKALIYTFHMHLFFYISGYVFSPGNSFKAFLNKKFNTIMLPYFLFGIVGVGFDTLRRFFGENPIWNDHSIFYPFVRIFLFRMFWFLPCLFLVSIIFYLIHRKISVRNFIPFACIMLIAHFVLSKIEPTIYRNVTVVPLNAIVFFAAGYIVKQNNFTVKHIYSIFVIPIYLVVFYWGYNRFGFESIRRFDNYFYQYAAAIAGILIIITLSRIIPKNKAMQFLGANTILIYLLHVYPPSVLHRLYGLLGLDFFNSPPLIWAFIYSVSNIILLTPIIMAINRWLPWVTGKFKSNYKGSTIIE